MAVSAVSDALGTSGTQPPLPPEAPREAVPEPVQTPPPQTPAAPLPEYEGTQVDVRA